MCKISLGSKKRNVTEQSPANFNTTTTTTKRRSLANLISGKKSTAAAVTPSQTTNKSSTFNNTKPPQPLNDRSSTATTTTTSIKLQVQGETIAEQNSITTTNTRSSSRQSPTLLPQLPAKPSTTITNRTSPPPPSLLAPSSPASAITSSPRASFGGGAGSKQPASLAAASAAMTSQPLKPGGNNVRDSNYLSTTAGATSDASSSGGGGGARSSSLDPRVLQNQRNSSQQPNKQPQSLRPTPQASGGGGSSANNALSADAAAKDGAHRLSHVISSLHVVQQNNSSALDAVNAAVQLKPKVKEIIAPILAQKDHEIKLLVQDVEVLQQEIEQLQGDYTELRDKYEASLVHSNATLATRDKRILQLERELANMRIALEMATDDQAGHGPLFRNTTTTHDSEMKLSITAGRGNTNDDSSAAAEVEQLGESLMRRAVVNDGGTSWMTRTRAESVVKVEKDNKTKQFLLRALRQNGMLGRLENARLIEIVEYMEPLEVEAGKELDAAGKTGKFFYVIEEGEVEVLKTNNTASSINNNNNNKCPVGIIHKGHCFGEVTLFFRIKRQASVITKTPCKLWRLSRAAYNVIMTVYGQRRLLEVQTFLRECPVFPNLDDRQLARLANGVQTEYYEKGEEILAEGSPTDGFYIVDKGTINMCKRAKNALTGEYEYTTVQTLEAGGYFGEAVFTASAGGGTLRKTPMPGVCISATAGAAPRSKHSMIAATDVRILTLEKSEFDRLLGHIDLHTHQKDKHAQREPNAALAFAAAAAGGGASGASGSGARGDSHYMTRYSIEIQDRMREMSMVKLDDLVRVAPLGQGSFGTVYLAKYTSPTYGEQYFALKAMSKAWVKKHNAMDHVLAEKKAWTTLSGSPFLCQLYATLKDARFLYYLMENLPGGDVYAHIIKQGHMSEDATRFYAGCMILALEWMHARNIIFRDLKPENVALDDIGYGKLIDFGFAKDISKTFRTFTFCGSPFYMAPEVVASEGHDYGCDIWSLGVTLVEIQTGTVPFANVHNEQGLFKKIARGYDGFDLPRTLHHRLRDLVKALCQRRPADRLGYDEAGVRDIRSHKYFEGFDWTAVEARKVSPPFRPEVTSPEDLRNARPPKEDKTSKEQEKGEDVQLWDFAF